MSAAHLHLLVNHLPILGSLFAVPILAWSLLKRDRTALLIGVFLLAISGAGAAVANQSGESAEDGVEGLPGVSEPLIHVHEERAEIATVASVVLALAALGIGGLAWRRPNGLPVSLSGALLAGSVVTAGLMAWTGASGGVIRHTEIRADSLASNTLSIPEGADEDD